jgi:hypothetical protein
MGWTLFFRNHRWHIAHLCVLRSNTIMQRWPQIAEYGSRFFKSVRQTGHCCLADWQLLDSVAFVRLDAAVCMDWLVFDWSPAPLWTSAIDLSSNASSMVTMGDGRWLVTLVNTMCSGKLAAWRLEKMVVNFLAMVRNGKRSDWCLNR